MTPRVANLVRAARVPKSTADWKDGNRNARRITNRAAAHFAGTASYVALCEANMAGLHQVDDEGWGGDVIMDDTPREIRKHLPILLHGHGKVLKTGLGLGPRAPDATSTCGSHGIGR